MKPDKNIEDFTKYVIEEAQVEGPSVDFVKKVMKSVILEKELSTIKNYKPLIPKTAWVLIIGVFSVLSFYMLTGSTQSSNIISKINLTFLDKISSFNLFESIHFSNSFTFSFIFFSVLVLFQLITIKNYFNRHDSV